MLIDWKGGYIYIYVYLKHIPRFVDLCRIEDKQTNKKHTRKLENKTESIIYF